MSVDFRPPRYTVRRSGPPNVTLASQVHVGPPHAIVTSKGTGPPLRNAASKRAVAAASPSSRSSTTSPSGVIATSRSAKIMVAQRLP